MKNMAFWIAPVLALAVSPAVWAATSNTGNNPAFLVIDVVTNDFEAWAPDAIDVGVDIGADGNVEYWASQDPSFVRANDRKGPSNSVNPGAWRTLLINLDQYAGETASVSIVDNSSSGFIAVNSVRLNFADGTMVANGVPNGFFEEDGLAGWTLTGDLAAGDILKTDEGVAATSYSTNYIETTVGGTATLVSDAFELTPVSSFVYGVFGGPASSFFDKPGAFGDEQNGILVYVDLGSESADPDGQYTEGEDIPLYGFLFRGPDGGMEGAIINTSGYEGRRAQFVAADLTEFAAVSFDAIRLNWDNDAIRNGGFEEGFETGVPEGFDGQQVRIPEQHPAGQIPGWTMNTITREGFEFDELSTFTFFGNPAGGFSRSGYVWVGSGSYDVGGDDGGLQGGIELRSDVFTIQPIPDPSSSVFMSFNSGQASSRIDAFATADAEASQNMIALEVDVDGNNSFGDEADFVYHQINQGMSWAAEQNGEMDEWHYPEYRFYIAGEHQGLQGRIYVEETTTGGWAWMAVDDFYFWDGSSAELAFPNSDFEQGDMSGWNEELLTDGFSSWLASNTPMNEPVAPADHTAMNNIVSWIDGDWSADSAPSEVASGDNSEGRLWSEPFTIPTLAGTNVGNWALFE